MTNKKKKRNLPKTKKTKRKSPRKTKTVRKTAKSGKKRGRPKNPAPSIHVQEDVIEGISVKRQRLFFIRNLKNWSKAFQKYADKVPRDKKMYREYSRVLADLALVVTERMEKDEQEQTLQGTE